MSQVAQAPSADEKIEPKERILEAAETLFAQKGYSGVGVRQLSALAGVNIAMINYYFGSKQGVLEELLDRFFTLYEETASAVFALGLPPQETLQEFVGRIVGLFGQHQQLVRIAMTELPLDNTDLAKFKAERVLKFIQTMHASHGEHMHHEQIDPREAIIRGPALISVLASHFLMKPVLESMGQVSFDKEFYAHLPQVLTQLICSGFHAEMQGCTHEG